MQGSVGGSRQGYFYPVRSWWVGDATGEGAPGESGGGRGGAWPAIHARARAGCWGSEQVLRKRRDHALAYTHVGTHTHTHTLKKMFLNDAMFRSSKRWLPSALWASRVASAEPGWLAEGTPKQGIQNWDRPRRATAIWHWRALIDPEQRKVGR